MKLSITFDNWFLIPIARNVFVVPIWSRLKCPIREKNFFKRNFWKTIFYVISNYRVTVRKIWLRWSIGPLECYDEKRIKGNEGAENQPSGCAPSFGAARRGTLRAAIIIIFTSPRVIKAARYTCSVRGRPLLTARTTPLAGIVGVATARSRGDHSREGTKRRNGEGNELEGASGVFVDGEERSTWKRDRIHSGRMRRVGGKGGWQGWCGGVREGGGVVFTRHDRWCCCCCCCFC